MSIKNIWVLFETKENTPVRVSLELMQKAHQLAREQGQDVKATAVLIGEDLDDAAALAFQNGADTVLEVHQPYGFEAAAYIVSKLIEKYQPAVILAGSTASGNDTSAQISARCGIGIACDCTGLTITEDGVDWIRPSYDGQLYATIHTDSFPQLGTFKQGIFTTEDLGLSSEGEIIQEDIAIPASVVLTQMLGFRPDNDLMQMDIENADIIIAGGRGCGSKEEFDKLYELAALVNGNVGASRPAVDDGWAPKDRQIGITGKTIAPKLYIGFGISGSVPHINGMKNSHVIVAVNNDPDAPIFQYAHYGIVADLHKVVPEMIRRLKELRN